MSEHDTLSRALDGLSTGLVGEDPPSPEPRPLWRRGVRQRWRERGVAAAVLAVAAALVAVGTLPLGGEPSTLPATGPDGLPTSYPARVAMPFGTGATSAPGVSALALPAERDGRRVVWAVGPTGAVRRVLSGPARFDGAAPADADSVSLSPDGRWLASSGGVHDLVSGRVAAVELGTRLRQVQNSLRGRPFWAPDSRRVYLPGESALPPSAGVVLDAVSGQAWVVPPPEGGPAAVSAGWRDTSSLVALWRTGPDTHRVSTWTVGDDGWREGPTITWAGPTTDTPLAAAVSPGGRSVLLLDQVEGADGSGPRTRAGLFDLGTGASAGSPTEWSGWGCRPAWRDGVPVATDDLAFRLAGGGSDPLVRVSSALGADGCPAVAGDVLRGRPVAASGAVWAERARSWGVPLGVLVTLGLALWWSGRGRRWMRPTGRLPFVYQVGGR